MRRALSLSLLYQCILMVIVTVCLVMNTPDRNLASLTERFHAWDARHYLYLSANGYTNIGDEGNLVVFFPLYPLLIRLNPLYLVSPVLSAVSITIVTSILGHMFLLLWLEDFPLTKRHALPIFLLFCLSPISIYFSLIYTEGLFLFLFTFFFYLLLQKKFLPAICIGFCASATKLIGITFVIPFFWAVMTQIPTWSQRLKWLAFGSIGMSLGLFLFFGINYVEYGNPMQWKEIEEVNWYKTTVNPVTQYIKEAKDFSLSSLTEVSADPFGTLSLDIFLTLLAPWIVAAYLLTNHTHEDLALSAFVGANLYIILSQSYWLSNTRYLGILFPLYFMIEKLTRHYKILYWSTAAVFSAVALLAILKFSAGGWVF